METNSMDNSGPSVGSALLLVIGEPMTDDHKDLILQEVTKGLSCWQREESGVDINEELTRLANRAEPGEEGPEVFVTGSNQSESLSERTLQQRLENLAVEILVNPRQETLHLALKNFFTAQVKYRQLVYAGHFFSGSGSWVLQDSIFDFKDLADVCKDKEIEEALKKQENGKIVFASNANGHWKASSFGRLEIAKYATVDVNPESKLDGLHGILQFSAYIGGFLHAKTLQELMRTSDVVGTIRFSRPTIYIFPACAGDSSLFGIKGFNLLVNGGFSRKSCFWDFTRHLDRIDAVLLTHLGTDNIFGISSVLKRKSMETIHPEIGYMFMNSSSEKTAPVTEGNSHKALDLSINLAEEGSKITEFAHKLGPPPQSCSRPVTQTLQPINLYHKVGHGSLDMYVLNPVSDSKELKDFYQQWNKHVAEFGSIQNVPMPNMMSICTLLVWLPADPNDNITRLLFPGNAPQHKVIEGLDRLKHLEFLKRPSCTANDLKKGVKKTSVKPSRPVSATSKTVETSFKKPEIKKDVKPAAATPREAKPQAPKPSAPPKKEDGAQKKADAKPAAKARPNSAPKTNAANRTFQKKTPADKTSPSKAPATKSPLKSPLKSPKSPSPPKKIEEQTPSPSEPLVSLETALDHNNTKEGSLDPAAPSLIDASPIEPAVPLDSCLVPSKTEQEDDQDKSESDSPDPLPNPKDYDPSHPTGEGSLMYGSFHQDLQDDLMNAGENNGENGFGSNGELIQPESLPEPVHGLSQGSDIIQDFTSPTKEESGGRGTCGFEAETIKPLEDQPSFRQEDTTPDEDMDKAPLQPEAVTDATQEDFEEQDEGEISPDEADSQEDISERLAKEDKSVSDFAFENKGFHQDTMDQTPDSEAELLPVDPARENTENPCLDAFDKDDDNEKNKEDDDSERYTQDEDGDEQSESQHPRGVSDAFERDESPDPSSDAEDEVQRPHTTEKTYESMKNDGGFNSFIGLNTDTQKQEDDDDEPESNFENQAQGYQEEPDLLSNLSASEQYSKTEGFDPFSSKSCLDKDLQDMEPSRQFDPESDWGKPFGLPAPAPPPPNSASAEKKSEPSKPKPSGNPSVSKSVANKTAAKNGKPNGSADKANKSLNLSPVDSKPSPGKARPASAVTNSTDPKPKLTKRPASASVPKTAVKLPPMNPFFMDLSYIPNHGDPGYCDAEFFKRVRAKNYVLSTLSPKAQVLDYLLEGKATWENKELKVTIIPTYDNDTLRHWMMLNKDKMADLNVEVAPSATRCTMQLQDHETSSLAFRVEF